MREKSGGRGISRRGFLKATGAIAATAAVSGSLKAELDKKALAQGVNPEGLEYVRSVCSPNCTGGCGIVAAVKDGQIKTLIQASDYPEEEGHNPRGCLKGLSMIDLIYGPQRMKGPQVLTGEPGSVDSLKDVSWDEALDTAASKLREIADKYGPESIACIVQVTGTGLVVKGAIARLAGINGWSMHGGYDMNGDLPMSAPETFGCQSEENETYCWPDSKLMLIFGSNIAVSRLPDAHFMTEARENGTKVLCFDPNFSVTASKCDAWYSIKPSSDAAVALGMVKRIIDTNKHDADFIKTYTDLAFLVDTATGKKLRAKETDGVSAPSDIPSYRESYVVMTKGGLKATDPTSLKPISGVELEGSFNVKVNGKTVKAKTGFTLLIEKLKEYTPEKVEELSDMPADSLVAIADEVATTKPTHIVYGASNYQWYHGDLKGRALSLLAAITGNIGKEGAGFSTYAGQYRMRFPCAAWWVSNMKKPNFIPFEYLVHGTTETMNKKIKWPKSGVKAWIFYCCNPFDQHNMNNELRRQVEEGDLELVINLDFQQTTSSLYSHVNLPGVSWYEKTELTTTPVHPYMQLQQKAVEPYADCKNELWILNELEKRYDPKAQKEFWPYGEDYDKATDQIIEVLLKNGGPQVAGITLEQLRQGPVKLKHANPGKKRIPYYEQIHDYQPFPPASYPETIETTGALVPSGRMEFYRDEDTFIEVKETLPVHKPPFEETEYKLDPSARDKYKLALLTRQTIHHVHSTHSNNLMMNELTDSKPRVFISPNVASERGISEGDKVEVYNGRNTATAWAAVDPGIRDDCLIFEEGWWSRYTGEGSYNAFIYPFINPTNEVYFVPQIWSPNTSWNERLVDVRKASE
ncbi:MAG: molybdopterin-dependent oxidoreductase [Coriobacteriales bacterium]|jgi:anaerobic selenocysteine-containing dehydrogenase